MTDSWRQLARWFVGHVVADNLDGTDVALEATWPVSPFTVALLIVTAAALTLVAYWLESQSTSRGWRVFLAVVRTALVVLVIGMLLGWTLQRRRMELADVVIVLDVSASMGVVDHQDDPSRADSVKERLAKLSLGDPARLNLAKLLLLENKAELLDDLSQRYKLHFYTAGESAQPLAVSRDEVESAVARLVPHEQASRLGNCLRDILDRQRGRSTAAVIMLTDGITTDGTSLTAAAQDARHCSVPLFIIGLGNEQPQRDLRLADLVVDDAAFLGDVLNCEARLVSQGYSGNAIVSLKRRGESTPLAEKSVALDESGTSQPIRLTHRTDQPGEFEYIVEVAPREGESNVENNRLARKVAVRDEAIRVLLVQAYPSYEFRFLKQMLQRELNAHQSTETKTAGFRTVLQEADLEYSQTDKTAERTFPTSRDELFQYDVLIFGDVNPTLLSRSIMSNIQDFVTVRGGGLIFIAGPRYTPIAYRDTPLQSLLPAEMDTLSVPGITTPQSEPFQPRLTPLGLASPTTQLADSPVDNEKLWHDDLAPLRWFVTANELRQGVRVLAEHPTQRTTSGSPVPIITLQFNGAGKVVFHATDETYRWRFRVGDVYFARHWLQTIRYLCRAKLLSGNRGVELSTDRREYSLGENVNLHLRFLDERQAPAADDGVSVVIQSDSGERRTISLRRHATDRGIFEGSGSAFRPDEYTATVAVPVFAESQPTQRFSVVVPPGELARTSMDAAELQQAAATSGGKFYTFDTADRLLEELPAGSPAYVEALPPLPIWNTPLVAVLFILLISIEWIARKRLGLL